MTLDYYFLILFLGRAEKHTQFQPLEGTVATDSRPAN